MNREDRRTYEVFEAAEKHVVRICGCPDRSIDGPSSPECLKALDLACVLAQDDILQAIIRSKHDVWLTGNLLGLARRVEALEGGDGKNGVLSQKKDGCG